MTKTQQNTAEFRAKGVIGHEGHVPEGGLLTGLFESSLGLEAAANESNLQGHQIDASLEPSTCNRCGHDTATVHIIHDGESIRLDCSRCERFIDFPVWHDFESATNYIQRDKDVASRNESR